MYIVHVQLYFPASRDPFSFVLAELAQQKLYPHTHALQVHFSSCKLFFSIFLLLAKLQNTGPLFLVCSQRCQNVLAPGNFAIYRQSFAACFTLEFPGNFLADRKTQSLLPTSYCFALLTATTNTFDRYGKPIVAKFKNDFLTIQSLF